MADINPAAPQDTDVVANYPANERASRAALLALLAGDAFGGGDMGGSGNAHTLTVANTGVTLTDGGLFWGVATATSTDACTLQVNSLTAKSLWLPNGTAISASHPGAITSGRLYIFCYHAADDAFYVENASGYMDQKLYDQLYKIGTTVLMATAAAPDVPYGVTATWTIDNSTAYLRATTGTPGTGGSLTTGSGGTHNHTGLTEANSASTVVESGGPTTVAATVHQHTFTTSTASDHTHTIEPSYISKRLYVRTA